MLAEISFYSFVLFVHIAAVVLAFGVTFSFPIVMSVARKRYERHMGFYHRMQALIGSRLIGPLGGLVLLAGLYLAIKGPYEFGDPWIGITLLLLDHHPGRRRRLHRARARSGSPRWPSATSRRARRGRA